VDHIKSQCDNLSELSDDEVMELQNSIMSEFDSVEGQEPTPETVDAMTSLADMLDAVKAEGTRREMAKQELAARAAEASARVKGSDEETDGTDDVTPSDDQMPADDETTPADGTDMPADDGTSPDAAPADDQAPMDQPDETPAEEPGDAPETPEEEQGETPEEEDEEHKKAYSTESNDASATVVEGSEFSTEQTAPEGTEVLSTETPNNNTEIAPEEQEGQAPVTAAAEESFQAPADRQPVAVQEVAAVAPVTITAGADIPGYTAGTEIKDMYEVASAMEKRIHSLRRVNGGDGEQHIVASFSTAYPEERTLTTDAEANAKKIAAVAGPEAIVASGGHAAPFEVKYDIYSIGSTTVRPVRDALPRFQADRGGIRYVTPPQFANGTYDAAVGIWTAAVDKAWTGTSPNNQTKTSLTVSAAQENTVSTDAVTLQLQFGNLMTRAYPELIARHNELALVQHAREAETNLLSSINAASTQVTTSSLIGFGRDFLVQIRRAAVAYRNRHRIDPNTQLQAVVPEWVYDAMAADLTLSMPGDNTISVSRGEIDAYLANSNVTLVASPDQNYFGAQGATALLEFPDSFTWFLYAEGTFLFLDGGTLDLGIIRDSTLVGTNDYKMFIETFEAVAKIGIESLAITSAISVNGVAAALRDTTGGATAAAIEY